MYESMFKTEQEVSEFLASRPKPVRRGSDYAIASLVSFPYESDEVQARACAYVTAFLEEYPSSYDNLTLRRQMVRVAPFLEGAGYIAAIEPLIRVRNRFEAELNDSFRTQPEWLVAVRNAIDILRLAREQVQLQYEGAAMNTILFLAADPTNESRLRLGEEFREIDEQLKLANQGGNLSLALPQLSLRPKDIARALLSTQPQIVHFSGHGTSEGALCFENEIGQRHLVQPDALSALFEQFADQVNCVVLNACYSDVQAKAIAKHINYVIGMNKVIGDKAAIAFALGYYQALGAGRTIEDAYKLGCVQIRIQGIPEHLTPVLIKKGHDQS